MKRSGYRISKECKAAFHDGVKSGEYGNNAFELLAEECGSGTSSPKFKKCRRKFVVDTLRSSRRSARESGDVSPTCAAAFAKGFTKAFMERADAEARRRRR